MSTEHLDLTQLDEYPKYACGNIPMVGDLIEFGTRKRNYIVVDIEDESNTFIVYAGNTMLHETSLQLTRLLARHGETTLDAWAKRASEDIIKNGGTGEYGK